jgi:hypothetical protein
VASPDGYVAAAVAAVWRAFGACWGVATGCEVGACSNPNSSSARSRRVLRRFEGPFEAPVRSAPESAVPPESRTRAASTIDRPLLEAAALVGVALGFCCSLRDAAGGVDCAGSILRGARSAIVPTMQTVAAPALLRHNARTLATVASRPPPPVAAIWTPVATSDLVVQGHDNGRNVRYRSRLTTPRLAAVPASGGAPR